MPNPNNPLAPGLNGAAPKGPRTIWDNPVLSAVLAIIMGFAMWIIVTVYIDPQGSTTVTGVPINYTSGASTYTAQGLDIVEKPDIEGVTVKVEGNSTIIGNIRSADIMVYPSYAGVSGAGKVTLRLQARVTNTTDFPGDIECTVESPSTIDVVFAEVSEKTVPVTVDASAVTISSGYMLNKTTAVPAEITLRGPTSELDQVSSIVAPVQVDGELADTTTVPATLELRDEEGNAFTPQYLDGERLRQRHADGLSGAGAAAEGGLHRHAERLRRREPALFAEPADPARGRSCPHDQRLGGPDRDGL